MRSQIRISTRMGSLALASFVGLALLAAIAVHGNEEDQPVAATKNEPRPIELKGNGRQATGPLALASGLAAVEIDHKGSENLLVRLLDADGNQVDTLFNQIGAFQGHRGFPIDREGQYLLDVVADGPWTIGIRQPRPQQGGSTPHFMRGHGYAMTDFVQLDNGLHVFRLTHSGSDRFQAILTEASGQPIETLINVIGNFDGSKPVRIEKAGIYFLNVSGDGDWTIDVE